MKSLTGFLKNAEGLGRLHSREREMVLIPVRLPNGTELKITAGGQNVLVKKIVEDFCPRLTPGGVVVYVGDTGDKQRQLRAPARRRVCLSSAAAGHCAEGIRGSV